MRRTGNTPASPATRREGCGRAGMTKDVALMTCSRWGYEDRSGRRAHRDDDRPHVALLQAEERSIAAAAAQQIVVPAALDDLAGLDHQDGVGVHDRVEAVGDDEGRAVLAEVLDRLLDLALGFGIERRGGLVEQDDRRVADQRARHGDALALAARQLRAVLAD